MKKVFVLIAFLMISVASSSTFARSHHPNVCSFSLTTSADTPIGMFLATTTTTAYVALSPATLIVCMFTDNAELNKIMIAREATMAIEENKVYTPSFLGAYADSHRMNLLDAAKDIIVNGVR